MLRRLAKSEGGFGLVELLIAMAVMSIGITAIVAGYSSGILAVDRAKADGSTAGALADRQMEAYRQGVVRGGAADCGPSAADNDADGVLLDAGRRVTGPARSRPSRPRGLRQRATSTPLSRPVKLVTINVRDGSAAGKLLFTESSTFDSSTG